MHCLNPREIVNPRYTRKTAKGRRALALWRGVHGDPRGYPEDYKIIIPCGKCLGCYRDKARSWRVRLLHEHIYGGHTSCLCLTLTISDENYYLFASRESSARLFRAFIDRLRYYVPGRKSPKRFFISELGEKTSRLHFHGFIWDVPSLTKEKLSKAWPYGFIDVKPLESARQLSYVTKYITKAKNAHDPLIFVSPGLGLAYTRNSRWVSWHHRGDSSNPINLCVRFDSYVYAMPTYYRKKIFSDAEISDFKAHLSECNESFKEFLGRTEFADPLLFAQARNRLFQTTIRSGKSKPIKFQRDPGALESLNPWDFDQQPYEFTENLTPF